jgi:hypothetical protein
MAFVLFAGLCLAALRHEEHYRGTGTTNLAFLALLAVPFCAFVRRKRIRDQVGQSIETFVSGLFGATLSRFNVGKGGRR